MALCLKGCVWLKMCSGTVPARGKRESSVNMAERNRSLPRTRGGQGGVKGGSRGSRLHATSHPSSAKAAPAPAQAGETRVPKGQCCLDSHAILVPPFPCRSGSRASARRAADGTAAPPNRVSSNFVSERAAWPPNWLPARPKSPRGTPLPFLGRPRPLVSLWRRCARPGTFKGGHADAASCSARRLSPAQAAPAGKTNYHNNAHSPNCTREHPETPQTVRELAFPPSQHAQLRACRQCSGKSAHCSIAVPSCTGGVEAAARTQPRSLSSTPPFFPVCAVQAPRPRLQRVRRPGDLPALACQRGSGLPSDDSALQPPWGPAAAQP